MIRLILAALAAFFISSASAQVPNVGGGMVPNASPIALGLSNVGSTINYSGTIIQTLGAVTGGSGYTPSGVINALGTITGGTGYVAGSYTPVPLTGGTGTGATALFQVNGAGVVTAVILSGSGTGYTIGDVLSASNTNLGGSGSGFSIPVSTTKYTGVPLTGGTGTGATATILVNAAGAVTTVALANGGTGYTQGDTLSAAVANIGGTGSGFSVPVSTVAGLQGGPLSSSILWGINTTLTGNATQTTPPIVAPYNIYISSDNANVPTGSMTGLSVETITTAGYGGVRTAIEGFQVAAGASGAGLINGGHVGVTGLTEIQVNQNGTTGVFGNYQGSGFGGNSAVILDSGASFIRLATAHEFDMSAKAGSSLAQKHGVLITQQSNDAVRGTYEDYALSISNRDGASAPWTYGLVFGGYSRQWPMGTDSTMIWAAPRVTGPASSLVALNGVDWSNITFSAGGCAYKSTGFCVDGPTGNIIASGTSAVTMSSGLLSIGGIGSAATLNTTGEGFLALSVGGGLLLGGRGSVNDFQLSNAGGNPVIVVPSGTRSFSMPGIVSDAGKTDTTLCQDTTNHTLFSGSGALGICLGTSGAQFKTAFAPMAAGIDDLMKINFQNFRYIKGFGDEGEQLQYGTTAQEIEKAIPDLVRRDTNNTPINYDSGALLFVGLRAIQQLKAENDNLRACNDNWKCRLFGVR